MICARLLPSNKSFHPAARSADESVFGAAGSCSIRPGDVLTAGHLGVLCSLGVRTVVVHPRLRVGVVSTGAAAASNGSEAAEAPAAAAAVETAPAAEAPAEGAADARPLLQDRAQRGVVRVERDVADEEDRRNESGRKHQRAVRHRLGRFHPRSHAPALGIAPPRHRALRRRSVRGYARAQGRPAQRCRRHAEGGSAPRQELVRRRATV